MVTQNLKKIERGRGHIFCVCGELVGRLEQDLHRYKMGHEEDLIKFGDLALIFNVTTELNRPIVSLCVCGGGGDICFSL